MAFRFDHAVFAVCDLDEAAARWWNAYGLASIPGGTHERWGTANRVVPLGRDYLELISVVDRQIAERTVLGRTLLELTADGDRWFSICLADDDIDATAARLGLPLETGARTRPDGTELRWRSAGIDAPAREPWLPFFIAWDVPEDEHPGRAPAQHREAVTGIEYAKVSGDRARLTAWLGGEPIDLRTIDGPTGLRAVAVSRSSGASLVVT